MIPHNRPFRQRLINTYANFEAQGSLVKIKIKNPKLTQFANKRSTRGRIGAFSRKSRKRLLELTARLDLKAATLGKHITFITLTYGQAWPENPEEPKAHLRALLERLRRFAPQSSGIWRLEFQERGAPHFHLILFDMPFLPKEQLKAAWGEIIGLSYWDKSQAIAKPPFTRIEAIKSGRRAVSYVSKYVAKADAPSDENAVAVSGFNNVPYLHAGRFWGIFNNEFLPYAELFEASLSIENYENQRVFFDYRRMMAKRYPAMRILHPMKGATLFVRESQDWIDYWFYLWLEHSHSPN